MPFLCAQLCMTAKSTDVLQKGSFVAVYTAFVNNYIETCVANGLRTKPCDAKTDHGGGRQS